MADTDTVQISWANVDAWEAQAAALMQKAEAAKVLLPPRSSLAQAQPEAVVPSEEDVIGDSGNFMGSIVEIANSVKWPISKAQMRDRLRALGFPEEKLHKRLDVILYKTKTANRIKFENGLISGVPK